MQNQELLPVVIIHVVTSWRSIFPEWKMSFSRISIITVLAEAGLGINRVIA